MATHIVPRSLREQEPSGSLGSGHQVEPTTASASVAVSADLSTFSAPSEEPQLDANRLHVYAVALELHCLCSTLVATLNRILKDQLERASLSVVLNTAEAMVPHYLLDETSCEKRRPWARQVAEATSILSPGRLPLVTWTWWTFPSLTQLTTVCVLTPK